MKKQEDLILGDSLQTILNETERLMPRISQYQFEREVLDILENPFTPEALHRYGIYVGELTKPLHVVDNNDQTKTLFMVPALVQSPITTIPRGNAITPESFLKTLSRDADLGGKHMHDKLLSFMTQITRVPNYIQNVIVPIQGILAQHGRAMVPVPGVEAPTATPTSGQPAEPSPSSFSDEYDD